MFNIKLITADSDYFTLVKNIRTSVFTNEQGLDGDREFDKLDNIGEPSLYALLFDEGTAGATARLVVTQNGYKIGRVAVLKSFRGKGYGDAVVRALLLKAFESGAQKVFVDSQIHAVPFYEKIGFKIIGGEVEDRGAIHIQMSIKNSDFKACCGG